MILKNRLCLKSIGGLLNLDLANKKVKLAKNIVKTKKESKAMNLLNHSKCKKFLCFILLFSMSFILTSCLIKSNDENKNIQEEKKNVNIIALKGPTSLGLVKLWNDSDENKTYSKYNISVVGDPSEAIAKFASSDADIGLLPTNMASILYNKTSGNLKVAAISTLGVLYIVSNDDSVKNISDLKDKTIYVSGQGATPEYALKYILEQNGLKVNKDVFIEYKSEHSELASGAISEKVSVALLPEPFVTQVTEKNSNIKVNLNLTEEWEKLSGKDSTLTMGCIVARKSFIEQNKEIFDKFLEDYRISAEYANQNLENTSQLADKYGIMQKEIAFKALPKCNVVFIDSDEMKNKIDKFLKILFNFEPKSVGGKMPNEEFYYKK